MLRLAAAIAILCLFASPANAFQASCDDVRQFVAEHGKAKALAVALKYGATWSDILRAKRCLSHASTK